ncbi:MAG: hypothetical protein CBB99_02380 [Bacteroidetes bacterium TMED39]|nr:MAG: hypothetical protein CBB99_02380 [Bacteroidetes bacterium TMED39]
MIFNEENIAKYLSGEMSQTETESFKQLLQIKNNEDTFSFYQKIYRQNIDFKSSINEDIAWQKIEPGKSLAPIKWQKIILLVASLVLVLGIISRMLVPDSLKWATQVGEVETIVLSDGSKIILNANSSFGIDEAYNKNIRKVFLEGEAYFNVAKNSSKPFWVEFSDHSLRVVGTSFNIQSRNKQTKIAVHTGEIQVFDKVGKEYRLKSGALFLNTYGKIDILTIEENENWAWKDDKFEYINEPISSICSDIKHRFGLVLLFPEAFQMKTLTLKLDNTNTSQLIRALETITQLQHREVDGQIIFK